MELLATLVGAIAGRRGTMPDDHVNRRAIQTPAAASPPIHITATKIIIKMLRIVFISHLNIKRRVFAGQGCAAIDLFPT